MDNIKKARMIFRAMVGDKIAQRHVNVDEVEKMNPDFRSWNEFLKLNHKELGLTIEDVLQ